MTKKCQISINKKASTGNNVSHSNCKTKRRFLPNIHCYSLMSEVLNRVIKFKASANSIRIIDFYDGLDGFLFHTLDYKLASKAIKIKKKLKKILIAKKK